MLKLYETVLSVLRQDERFFTEDGNLLRNAVYEATMKMDNNLIKILLENKDTCAKFFVEVDGIKVFDKQSFAWVINNRQFLPDSYTRFKNKIGLVNENGEMISSSGNVELVFPYKDCVLEGGQTQEDQKRKEIFYNCTLASDEVDRLLYPKVFTNAMKFTADGESEAEDFSNENLVVKGNNLLTLASLSKKYNGQVKCIYIDPPYNTGKKNSFGYNDSFNHSTWLSFMKTRLEYARKLLMNEGCILIQTDDKEQAYLKVLCDEVFGPEQYETTFFVQVRYTNKTLAEDSTLHKVMETVHVYSKNHASFRINKIKEQYSLEKFCWEIVEKEQPSETIEVGGKVVDIFKDGQYEISKVEPHIDGLKETWATGSLIRQGGTAAEFLSKYLIERKKQDGLKVLYKVHNMGEDGLGFRYILGPQRASAFRGKFYSGVPTSIKEEVRTGAYDKEKPVPNLIYNYLSSEGDFGNCRTEGGVDIEGGKKPEQLIKFFLEYFSNEGDLILDFFGGSGTTAAVAHKMGRRYITCEQMDNQIEMIKSRLKDVINGESSGISSEVEWKGGGSFVFCELKKLNQNIVEKIEVAKTDDELAKILETMEESGFISYKVNPKEINDNIQEFNELSLDEKKHLLMEVLDKNLLYVNYCDMDDAEFEISTKDKAFTNSFYTEG